MPTELEQLEKLLHQRMDALERAMAATFAAQEKAIIKAENATEKRFESVNEFRKTLADQNTTFVPRAEFSRAVEVLKEAIDELKSYKDANVGRWGGINSGWSFLAGGIAVAISVATFFVK